MARNSPDLGDAVEEDNIKGNRGNYTREGNPDQVRVKMNFGTKEFSSDRDNCVQCDSDMEKVVVVDHGTLKGTDMSREAIPVCNDHLREVVQSEEPGATNIEVKE